VCTVGYLFNVHQCISHHSNLQKHVYTALEKVAITVKEAQALDEMAKEYHDSNYNETYIPPFEIYKTSASHSNGKNCTVTDTIGVKSTIMHAALLKEMLV